MDKVLVQGLQVETIIGIHDWERRVRQALFIDLELAVDANRAAVTDDIADALDYQAVCACVVRFIDQGEFRLLETLCDRLADHLLAEFSPGWLRLSVHKPGAVPAARAVGVTIERGSSVP